MREIKFRVWDKYKNQLYICDDIYFAQEPLNEAFKLDEFAFMQYTGLTDADGKEIYEGDIVVEGYKGKYGTYEVKWNKIGFNLGSEDGRDYEVIGNIYENSNLLESENDNGE